MNERLTDNDVLCMDCALADKYDVKCVDYQRYEKLREYEELEEQGFVFRPPVRIGQIVYVTHPMTPLLFRKGYKKHRPYKAKVTDINFYSDRRTSFDVYSDSFGTSEFYTYSIGRDIFFTKEEAVAKLEEMGVKHHD